MAQKGQGGIARVAKAIGSQVFSYGVAGVCGAVAAIVVGWWDEAQETEGYRIGENSGIAYPGPMFDNVEREGYRIEFKPPEFQGIAVCEWSVARGRTWWEFAQDYLQRYPACFVVRSVSDNVTEVYPNRISEHWSGLQYNGSTGTYWCKCPPEISGIQ